MATLPKGRAAATGQDDGENPRLAGEGIAPRTRGYGASRPFNSRGVGRTTGSAVPLAPSTAPAPRTTGFAVCAKGGPADALVAVASVPGPTKAGSAARATATCPKGMGLTGGGGDVTMKDGSTPPRHYFVAGSFPSRTEGVPAAGGSAAASWTTVGAIGGMPLQGGEVTAFAVCANGASTTVAVKTVGGPSEPMSAATATVACPAGQSLVGGGANTGLPKGGNPPQGLHLRGSFPGTGKGGPSALNVALQSWTAIGNAGGMVVLGASTSAFALCAR